MSTSSPKLLIAAVTLASSDQVVKGRMIIKRSGTKGIVMWG